MTTQTARRGALSNSSASRRSPTVSLTQGLTRLRRWLGWMWVPLSVFVLARGISIVMMLNAVDDQVAFSPDLPLPVLHVFYAVPASPNFWEASTNWDGQWYRLIAERGYPSDLPMVDGEVAMNAWAFYPLYPMVVRLFMSATGASFIVVAPLVSLVAALAGSLVLYRLIQRVSNSTFVAAVAILALHTHPASASFQVAYTEGVALLLIALGLKCIYDARYGALVLVAVLLSFTRPIAIVLAAVLAVLLAFQIVQARRGQLPRPRIVKPLVAVALTTATMGLWPITVAVNTGDPDAFTQTQAAWPGNQTGMGLLGSWLIGGIFSGRLLALGVGLFVLLVVVFGVTRSSARGWGFGIRAWAVLYTLYLLLATRPVPSIIRYLLLVAAPVVAIPEPVPLTGTRAQRSLKIGFPLLVCAISLLAQYFWLDRFYAVRPETQLYP